MINITELTAEKLEEIRKRYRPTEVPKCHICGAEMTIQRMSASRITYGCAGAIYDETGCHYAEGRSLADDHYAESRITVVDVSDPDVLAMVGALEKAQNENELARGQLLIAHRTLLNQQQSIADLVTGRQNLQQTMGVYVHAYEEAKGQVAKDVEIKARLCCESNSLFDRLRAAEKCIAELESRTVKLPDDEDGQAYGFGKWSNGKLPATAGTMTISYCEDAWRAAFEVFSSAAGIKVEAK